uniref:Protein NEDD1 isoform X2 n=1 Tax=Rhizophora mucronata TaxID=61149 RepID=A0A2P2L542_RHIMU
MPDPLPSVTSSSLSPSTSVFGYRNARRSGPTVETSSITAISSVSAPSTSSLSLEGETPHRSHLWPGGTLRLQAPQPGYNFKDDMEVFSPLVDVQPITPSLDKLWNDHEGSRKDNLAIDKKPASLFTSSTRRFPFAEDRANDHPIFDWKSSSSPRQDETRSSVALLGGSTPTSSSKIENSSITPPEAWGGERISDKLNQLRQPLNLPSRFAMLASGGLTSGPMSSGLQDSSSSTNHTSTSSLNNPSLSFSNVRTKDFSSSQGTSMGFPEHISSSSMPSIVAKGIMGSANLEASGAGSLTLPRRFSSYAERISTTSSFSDRTSASVSSPKIKKTGAETREELLNSFLLKSDTLAVTDLATNGGSSHLHKDPQPDSQQGSSFMLQLFQRTLEETLDSFQRSIHEDMRNLHIEILRQFHMQEMELSSVMSSILENQAELMKEIKFLRKENQELRQLL